ncbi:MAG: conjugal transfer protein TraX [Clostridia bacterium]|nr:conjugal transfer protein TraX [Clostridia bacterium]
MMPERFRILSGSALKVIALICMIIDHTAKSFYSKLSLIVFKIPLLTKHKDLYWLMTRIGRIAFPIYCFLLVEGFLHTRDKKKYALRLFVFAVISEIPWDLIHFNKVFDLSGQNVFFTLFLGVLGMFLFEHFENNRVRQVVSLLLIMLVTIFLRADYGISGFCFILMLYALHDKWLLKSVIGCGFLSSTFFAGLAFLPINLYNEKRGFIKGKVLQYAFYAIYPIHLLILHFIR